jgi:hypothetical protein
LRRLVVLDTEFRVLAGGATRRTVERPAGDVLRPVRAEDFLVLRLAEEVLLPAGVLLPEEVFLAEEVFFER